MKFNQIIYCNEEEKNSKHLLYLQHKLNAVVKYYKDFYDFKFFDNNIIISDHIENCDKYFQDFIKLNECILVNLYQIDDKFIFNTIENSINKSMLGAGSFQGSKKLDIKLLDSFSFIFEHNKKTLEKISIELDCKDKKFSQFQVSLFNGNTGKCFYNNVIRYMESHTVKHNEKQDSEFFLEINLNNPDFDAMGKKYTVTVKFLNASNSDEICTLKWNNDYSPYKFSHNSADLLGCLNFFAY